MHNKYTQTHLGGVTHTWQSLSQTCIHVRRSFHIPAAERYSTLHNPCDLKISQIPRDLAEPWGDFTLSLCYEGGWLACFRRHLAQSKHSVASFQPALISAQEGESDQCICLDFVIIPMTKKVTHLERAHKGIVH